MAAPNPAFSLLADLLRDSVSDLPSWIGFYAGGKTDVCHPRWDSDFDGAKADRDGLPEALASTSVVVPALLLWLDDFMTAHRVHSCWKHTLDGGCLWHQFEQGGDNYLFNAMWALTLTVVCWLRHVCKGKKVPQVRLICLCNAGKHRSVFSSRMLYFVLQLLYDLLGIQQRRFTWQWAAERRVQANAATTRRRKSASDRRTWWCRAPDGCSLAAEFRRTCTACSCWTRTFESIRWLQRYLPRHAQVHPSGCRRARHAPQKSLAGRLAGRRRPRCPYRSRPRCTSASFPPPLVPYHARSAASFPGAMWLVRLSLSAQHALGHACSGNTRALHFYWGWCVFSDHLPGSSVCCGFFERFPKSSLWQWCGFSARRCRGRCVFSDRLPESSHDSQTCVG